MPMWDEQIVTPSHPFDPKEFRNALSCFPTGVCLITTRRPDGKREGLTANSFSSVSLNPPMVLWSLVRRSLSAAAFRDAEFFAINVMAADQEALSTHFSRKAEDKFAVFESSFVEGLGGIPVLEGAVARFECRNQFQNYGGDHIVFIGTVERYACWAREPLLFHRGRYAAIDRKDAEPA